MSLIKRTNGGLQQPFRTLLTDFFDADDFMFNRLFKNEGMPAVNILETDKYFEIELAAPGMEKKDFKVAVENGILTISSEQKEEKEENKRNFTRREFHFNSFTRSFTLPENVKDDDIKARYEDGILKLNLAKKAVTVSKAKEIAIA